jgi:biotin carboxylase
MKEVLKKGGVNVPEFVKVSSVKKLLSFIAKVKYPVVIKPVDNSGARGVLRVTKEVNLQWAFDYARQFSYSGGVLAEKFIDGLQISTEGLMVDGVFYCTGFADRNYNRIDLTVPYLVEDGGDIPTVLNSKEKEKVIKEFEKAIRVLGINWGPAKGDMVFGKDGKAYVIEIAARLSGGNFCYDKVPWSTGVDIVDVLIDLSVGNAVDIKKFKPTKSMATAQRYFFPPPGKIKKIRNIQQVEKMSHIKKVDVWVKPGDIVPALVNHPSRVGYVIACAPTLVQAITTAKKAVQTVEFDMAQ